MAGEDVEEEKTTTLVKVGSIRAAIKYVTQKHSNRLRADRSNYSDWVTTTDWATSLLP